MHVRVLANEREVFSARDIAEQLGRQRTAIYLVLKVLRIKPVQKVGKTGMYSKDQIKQIREALG